MGSSRISWRIAEVRADLGLTLWRWPSPSCEVVRAFHQADDALARAHRVVNPSAHVESRRYSRV